MTLVWTEKEARRTNPTKEHIKKVLADYLDLFSKVEQSFSDPVDEKTLERYREIAKKAAIDMAARKIDSGEKIEIPIEIAALYRENLENPHLMNMDEASRVR